MIDFEVFPGPLVSDIRVFADVWTPMRRRGSFNLNVEVWLDGPPLASRRANEPDLVKHLASLPAFKIARSQRTVTVEVLVPAATPPDTRPKPLAERMQEIEFLFVPVSTSVAEQLVRAAAKARDPELRAWLQGLHEEIEQALRAHRPGEFGEFAAARYFANLSGGGPSRPDRDDGSATELPRAGLLSLVVLDEAKLRARLATMSDPELQAFRDSLAHALSDLNGAKVLAAVYGPDVSRASGDDFLYARAGLVRSGASTMEAAMRGERIPSVERAEWLVSAAEDEYRKRHDTDPDWPTKYWIESSV